MAPREKTGRQAREKGTANAAAENAKGHGAGGHGAANAAAEEGEAFAIQCEAFRRYYTSLGKAEWWWIMDDVQEAIGRQLTADGYVVLDHLVTEAQALQLHTEVCACHAAGELTVAGLVNGRQVDKEEAKYADTATRGDVIGWFDSTTKGWPYGRGLDKYLLKLGTLISELGKLVPELARITSRSKAMVACYPGGGSRYVKHVDNDGKHPLCRTRVLTALMYLNPEWEQGDGGELVVYDAEDTNARRRVVAPLCNRVLLFWSDWRTPHEVLAAQKDRYAVTLWLLDNTQRPDTAVTPPEAQAAAQAATSAEEKAPAVTTEAVVAASAATGDAATSPPEAPTALGASGSSAALVAQAGVTGAAGSAPAEEEVIQYEWLQLESAEALDEWELRITLEAPVEGGEVLRCPTLDISEAQVRVTTAMGDPLVCLPLPLRAASAGVLRWSKRRGQLTARFRPPLLAPTPGSAPSGVGGGTGATALYEQLGARGWGVLDGFLAGPEADSLRRFVLEERAAGRLSVGGNLHEGETGSGRIKNDEYSFVEGMETGGSATEPLRRCARRCNELLVGVLRSGCAPSLEGVHVTQGRPMVAVYPGDGARYGRHYDSTPDSRGANGRVLTLVIYLNPYWRKEHGGVLRLLDTLADSEEAGHDVEPLHGRLVAFLCQGRCPHEVLPSWRERVAVTLWYYDGAKLAERCKGDSIKGYGFEGE